MTKFFNLATFFFLSYKRNYLEIFMLPTLNPPPPPWAWVTFLAVFQLPRHSECQQPDPRSSMRHFRTFPSHGITAEDPPVSRMRRLAHETTSEDPSREQNAPSRSRDNLGRPLREQNAPSRSRDDLGRPFREQNAPSRSRDNLGRPSREQNAPSRSRDDLGRLFPEQNAPSRSRDNLGRHRQAFPVPILSPGHFGTPDKPLLYQKLSHSLFRITYFLRSCFELFV